MTDQAESTPHLLMSPPDHFEVSYAINPWMEPARWAEDATRLARDATEGWNALKACYENLGARVTVQPPARGWPDLVFTANAAIVLDGKCVLSRFRHPQRVGEEPLNQKFFEQLKAEGVIDEIHHMPHGVYFEGAGDAVIDLQRRLIWTGHGPRSSFVAAETLAERFQLPALPLQLIDPRYYHLDTCFCLLSGGELMVYPGAFLPDEFALIREHAGADLIEVSPEDAQLLAANAVCIGRDVVMCHAGDALRHTLERRGYRVHVIPLGSFNRSGGAACCLTLRLDQIWRGRRRHA